MVRKAYDYCHSAEKFIEKLNKINDKISNINSGIPFSKENKIKNT